MPTTTNFGWTTPTPGGDTGAWGAILNALFDDMDDMLFGWLTESSVFLEGLHSQTLASEGFEPSGDSATPGERQWNAVTSPRHEMQFQGGGGDVVPFYIPLKGFEGYAINTISIWGRVASGAAATASFVKITSLGVETELHAGVSLPGTFGEVQITALDVDVEQRTGNQYFVKIDVDTDAGVVAVTAVAVEASTEP